MVALELKFCKRLTQMIKYTHLIVQAPYTWDFKRQTLQYENSRYRASIFAFNLILHVAYLGFIFARFIVMLRSENHVPAKVIVNLGYNLAACFLPMLFFVEIAVNWGGHAPLLNAALQYYDQATEQQAVGTLKDTKITVLIRVLKFSLFAKISNYWRRPDQHHLLSSLCGPTALKSLKVPFLLLHLYIWLMQNCAIAFVEGLYFVMFKAVTGTMEKFTQTSSMSTNGTAKLRKIAPKEYRRLSVLLASINQDFHWMLLYFEAICMVMVVFCFSAAAGNDGILAVWLVFIGSVIFLLLLEVLSSIADVHDQSEKMLASWKELPRQDEWMRRFLRSTKTKGILVGSYFTVDKRSVLTVAGIIISNTINTLITTSK